MTQKRNSILHNTWSNRDHHTELSQTMFAFVWHVFSRQNLEQCWRAELWPAAGETEGPPTQGKGSGLFLWRHDCPQHPHGHETSGIGRRVSTHWQVSGAITLIFFLRGFLLRKICLCLCVLQVTYWNYEIEVYHWILDFLCLVCACRSYIVFRVLIHLEQ